MCTLLTSRATASHTPPINPTGLPTTWGSLSSLCWTPGLGGPICGLNHSPSKEALLPYHLPFPLGPLLKALVPTWLFPSPSSPVRCGSFFCPYLQKTVSAIFQWFSVRIFTHIDVFLYVCGGSEFHNLPLHHLDPNLKVCSFG